jgi:hypothetical protein
MLHHNLLHPVIDKDAGQQGEAVMSPHREPTPLQLAPKSLRPYLKALLSFKNGHEFQSKPSVHRMRRRSELAEKEGNLAAAALQVRITSNLLT